MEKELIDRIKKSGFKKKHIAKRVGISPNFLSMCINGKRNLSKTNEEKIKAIL